jgi:hypothetical protein
VQVNVSEDEARKAEVDDWKLQNIVNVFVMFAFDPLDAQPFPRRRRHRSSAGRVRKQTTAILNRDIFMRDRNLRSGHSTTDSLH